MKNLRKIIRRIIRESIISEREVSAYHGSPHEFDKFTTSKIGTGEGAQAFGWGLYFTDMEDIAKHYAQNLSKSTQNDQLDFLKKALLNNKITEKDFKEIDEIWNNLSLSIGFYGSEHAFEELISKLKDNNSAIDFLKQNKENFLKPKNGMIYQVKLHKDKKPDQYNWLEWDKPISEKNIIKIFNGAEKVGGIDFKDGWDLDSKYGLTNRGGFKINGEEMYRWLSKKLNGDKQASLFLLDAGIDGIKYPADSISRSVTSDTARGYNYVVFDENAVSIEKVDKI